MPVPSVAVVILNYNGLNFLKQFLPTVITYSQGTAIIVADNNSSDGSPEFVENTYPSVRVIRNGSNNGYTGGYNAALKQVSADYYVLLNSDVEVTPNWWQPVVAQMEADRSIAAAQPKLLDFKERQTFEYAGGSGGYLDYYGYPFCRGRVFETLETDRGQYDTAEEIFWASGACMFVRASAFHQAGGFDERYFAHMEEIDLCWRLKNKGYKIYAVPQSLVYHVGGGTLNKQNPRKTFLNFRNNLSTLTKNHTSPFWMCIVFYRLLLDGVAGLKFLSAGQVALFWQVIRAHFAYYAWLPYLLKQRQLHKPGQSVSPNNNGLFRGNVVVAYYLKKKRLFSEVVTKQ